MGQHHVNDEELQNPGECALCGEVVEERCGDNACRACHKSLSFESCVDGSWVREMRCAAGLPT